jgi:hypothetical protein
MTKIEAVKLYKMENSEFIKECKARKDRVMLRIAWNDWTDSLCKDGVITENQYNKWFNPF